MQSPNLVPLKTSLFGLFDFNSDYKQLPHKLMVARKNHGKTSLANFLI